MATKNAAPSPRAAKPRPAMSRPVEKSAPKMGRACPTPASNAVPATYTR